MAKRKKQEEPPVPVTAERPVVDQTPYRPSDPRMLTQLDLLAKIENRPSRNNMIDTLVLKGLVAAGLWPPPVDEAD